MNNRFTRKIKDRLNQNEWSWWHLLGIFLICLLNVTAQFSLLTKPYLSIPLMLFNAIVFTGIIKHSIDSGEDTAKFDIKNMLKVVLIWLGFMIISVIIISLMNKLSISSTPENQIALEKVLLSRPLESKLIACFSIAFISPMSEELIFRYYLMKSGKLFKTRVIISTLLFVIMHSGFNPIYAMYYIPMAIGMTFTRLHFKSTRFSYEYHCLQNMLAVMIIFSL